MVCPNCQLLAILLGCSERGRSSGIIWIDIVSSVVENISRHSYFTGVLLRDLVWRHCSTAKELI